VAKTRVNGHAAHEDYPTLASIANKLFADENRRSATTAKHYSLCSVMPSSQPKGGVMYVQYSVEHPDRGAETNKRNGNDK
jgi:hypothetical protein